jgi:crotonobetaine/carnitine-CoA ligase
MNIDTIVGQFPFPERTPVEMLRRRMRDEAVFATQASDGQSYSCADVARLAARVASFLRGLGVQPGDRVAWIAPASIESIALWLGISAAGAVDICIGEALKGPLLQQVLADSAPTVLLIDQRAGGGIDGLAPERLAVFRHVVSVGPDGEGRPGALPFDLHARMTAAEEEFDPVPQRPQDLATIVYTSGTTGPSKGVMICHHHLFFVGAGFAEKFRIEPDSVVYHYSPYNHITGRQLITAALSTGARLILREHFSLRSFWADINGYGCTHAITLGSAVPLLLDQRGDDAVNRGSLTYVWASPAMPGPYAEFERRFGVLVAVPFGSTETGIVTLPGLGDATAPPGNSGRQCDQFDLGIVDENEQLGPPGTVGEIVVRPRFGWTTLLGYLNREAVTLETTRNLWYHTGDYGRMDARGYLFFVDRKQDFIRVKGENVSSSEVEQVLVLNPGVADCTVVAVPSVLGEDEIMACVVLSASATSGHAAFDHAAFDHAAFDHAAFYAWAADQLPYFMVPRYVQVVDDLPRGHSGKVEKYKLRAAGVTPETWDAAAAGLRASRHGVIAAEAPAVAGQPAVPAVAVRPPVQPAAADKAVPA